MIEICCFVVPRERLGASGFTPNVGRQAPVSVGSLFQRFWVVIVNFLGVWMVLEVPVTW